MWRVCCPGLEGGGGPLMIGPLSQALSGGYQLYNAVWPVATVPPRRGVGVSASHSLNDSLASLYVGLSVVGIWT
ncbi:hypothetical protein PGTUg99_032292 [Puccinia graminis f. sp. tritici]|uniref:Uncharacterized protein n=1 Tax=Puccinia graminis f. sp. tritici TaxID=56615 RepID=A0A5B0SM24_PUCGR|nr:hypothetical protein PGTUg99_032292 [Puccinia graminis f. sp. tritici]